MHIGIIGKSFGELNSYLDKNGYSYTLIKDVKKAPRRPNKNTIYVDFSDKKTVIEEIKKLNNSNPLDGVLTFYEQYIVFNAEIAEALKLPGLSVDSSIACTNKFVMRTLFGNSSKKISPDFCIVKSTQEVKSFAANHSFPLILKPANLAKSLLVTKSNNLDELLKNFEETSSKMDRVYKKYAPHNEKILILEEFMEGSIHSVDAFIDSRGDVHILDCIVDYQTGYDVGYNDNFHYSRIIPSRLTYDEQEAIVEVARLGVKALKMTSSAAHIEIILTSNGPMIVEIGARNGGYRERMHRLANGIDLYSNLLSVTTGLDNINITKKHDDFCAVLELFPRQQGKFESIKNLKKIEGLQGLSFLNIKYDIGDEIGTSSDGYKAVCVIGIINEDNDIFTKNLEFIRNNIEITVNL